MRTDSLLHQPVYSIAEAARLLHMTHTRVARWLYGYKYEWGPDHRRQRGKQPPVINRGRSAELRAASFLDLMELLFAKAFLDNGISLRKVRRALEDARQYVDEDHPFARRRFFTWKQAIFMELPDNTTLVELLAGGQLAIRPVVLEIAKQIEFDKDTELALGWWPLGKTKPIVITPRISFGTPCVASTGTKTTNVYDLFLAENHDEQAVCDWLNLNSRQVGAAVEFEQSLRNVA